MALLLGTILVLTVLSAIVGCTDEQIRSERWN